MKHITLIAYLKRVGQSLTYLMLFLNNQGQSGVLEVMKTSARYYNKNVGIHYAFTFYDAATLIHLTFLPSKRVTYNFTVESSVRSMPYKEFNNLAQAQSYLAKFLE